MSGSMGAERVVKEPRRPGCERYRWAGPGGPWGEGRRSGWEACPRGPTPGLGCSCSQRPRPSIGAGPCLRKTLGGAGGKAPRQQTTLRPEAADRFSGTLGVRLPGSRPRPLTCATLGTGLENAYPLLFLRAELDLAIPDPPSCRCSKADI